MYYVRKWPKTNRVVQIWCKNAVLKYHSGIIYTKIISFANFFLSISSFNLDFFCYFCTWFPLSYLIGRCTTPVRQPNSKGSIEVHAMLKHAMVTHQMLKRVLGGRSPYLRKGVCMRFSFYTPNFEHLDYSVERLATADVPGCDYSHPSIDIYSFMPLRCGEVCCIGVLIISGVGFGVAYLTE